MIVVRISGGLGNQMYQYALLLSLQKKYSMTKVLADIFDYEKIYAHTGFSLEKYFELEVEKATREEINNVAYVPVEMQYDMQNYYKLNHIERVIYKYKLRKRKEKKIFNIEQQQFNDYYEYLYGLDQKCDWYISGYWQNTLYFEEYLPQLREKFKFKRKLNAVDLKILEKIRNSNSVSVHVRRGDYVNSEFDLCGQDYYMKAKSIIDKKIEKPHYFFFTDDAEFVKKTFGHWENVTIVEHSAEDCDYDLYLMSQCKNHIMANSSFSAWGTLLSINQGINIAPRYTMKKNNILFRTLFVKDWIYIDTN